MVKKKHTRLKRRKDLTSSFQHRGFFSNKKRKKGAKTFRTKEQAEAYAKEQKLKDYEIISAKKGKRFKIEQN
jgi:hypothetical protein